VSVSDGNTIGAKACGACGAENRAEARFCRNCGVRFDGAVSAISGVPTPENSSRQVDAAGGHPDRLAGAPRRSVLGIPTDLLLGLGCVVLVVCAAALAYNLAEKKDAAIAAAAASAQATALDARAAAALDAQTAAATHQTPPSLASVPASDAVSGQSQQARDEAAASDASAAAASADASAAAAQAAADEPQTAAATAGNSLVSTHYACTLAPDLSQNPIPDAQDTSFTIDESRACVNNRAVYIRLRDGTLAKSMLNDQEHRVSFLTISRDRTKFIRVDNNLTNEAYLQLRRTNHNLSNLACAPPGDGQGTVLTQQLLARASTGLRFDENSVVSRRRTGWRCAASTE